MTHLFNILNLVLAAGILYIGAVTFLPAGQNKADNAAAGMHPVSGSRTGPGDPGAGKPGSGRALPGSVTGRNLFQVDLAEKEPIQDDPAPGAQVAALEPTRLKLTLWGTVAVGPAFYAVIEDQTTRQQELYETGDEIQDAQIKDIYPRKVVLVYQGKRQVLEMSEEPNPRKQISPFAVGKSVPPARASGGLALPEIGKTPVSSPDRAERRLAPQVKFRPHTSQGEVDGMMVYGIRPGSIFRKYGLRNGDVVQAVNQALVTTQEDAQGLFEDPESWEGATVTLIRRGQIKELRVGTGDEGSDNL